jgi:glycosyltransferase EpsF
MLQEIIKEKKDVRLVLIGDGELRAQMEKKVRLFHLDEKVLFLGLRNDMPSLYNLMDVFVLPSWYEGLPVVSVEAQANGLYCLVSNRVSKECKLTESLEFLPLELGPKAWADRILKVPIERNEHAVQDLQKNNFDICREANKILELYEA